jgi:hypothetical protein
MRNPVKRTGLRNKRMGGKARGNNFLVPSFTQLINDLWRGQYLRPEIQELYRLCLKTDHL